MRDGSKQQPKVTAGSDLGDKYSYLCLIDRESGQVIEEGRLRTTPEAFLRRFASEQPMRIAIEAGTHSPWASRVLEGCGHEILVANARKLRLRKLRLSYSNKRKTDEVDAENLSRLARLDPKLLYPLEHRGEESRAHMALIRSREALVSTRTQLVNHVRGALKSFGARLPKCPARKARRVRLPCVRSLRISSMRRLRNCELGPPSVRRRDRSEDCSAFSIVRKDGSHDAPSHRRVGSLKVRMEAQREGHTAVTLGHSAAATSALTKCAFSWKFAFGIVNILPN
jgi:Transposase